jgi:hypothetical protein
MLNRGGKRASILPHICEESANQIKEQAFVDRKSLHKGKQLAAALD